MFHQHSSTTRDSSVFAYSIVVVFIVGCILGAIPLSWEVPVYEIDPRMTVKPSPTTLE